MCDDHFYLDRHRHCVDRIKDRRNAEKKTMSACFSPILTALIKRAAQNRRMRCSKVSKYQKSPLYKVFLNALTVSIKALTLSGST